jgi:hypothetical protein
LGYSSGIARPLGVLNHHLFSQLESLIILTDIY